MQEKFGKYAIPYKTVFIGSGENRLYKLEEKRREATRKCVEELMIIFGLPKADYWTVAVPEALKNCLGSFESRPGVAAAIGYLVSELSRPGFDDMRKEVIPHLEGIIEHFKQMDGGGE